MDYVKIIETWLKNYRSMLLQLESLKILYENLELEIKEGTAVDYTRDKLSQSYKITSEVENYAIKLAMLKDRMKHLEDKINILNKGLDRISQKERQVLELRYIEGYKWNKIVGIMHYDYSWCQELRRRGIESMCKVMFGEE